MLLVLDLRIVGMWEILLKEPGKLVTEKKEMCLRHKDIYKVRYV